jgi:hypothetical protein
MRIGVVYFEYKDLDKYPDKYEKHIRIKNKNNFIAW